MKPLLMVTLQHFTNHFKEASILFFDCIKKKCAGLMVVFSFNIVIVQSFWLKRIENCKADLVLILFYMLKNSV